MSVEVQARTIKRDGKFIHQFSYDGEEWHDIAWITSDPRPQFYFGKSWTDHIKDH